MSTFWAAFAGTIAGYFSLCLIVAVLFLIIARKDDVSR